MPETSIIVNHLASIVTRSAYTQPTFVISSHIHAQHPLTLIPFSHAKQET